MSLRPSGGTAIALHHAESLSSFARITIILPNAERKIETNSYIQLIEALNWDIRFDDEPLEFDLVLLTFWGTLAHALSSSITSKDWIHFCQSLEDRFTARPNSPLLSEIAAAQTIYGLNIPTITEALWIKEALDTRGPSKSILVRNPILLSETGCKATQFFGGVNPELLRVVIEGERSWFKGVNEALKAVSKVKDCELEVHIVGEKHRLSKKNRNIRYIQHGRVPRETFHKILAESDLLIKMSHVEGMYGPPLESFALGTTCITTAVTGSEEFIKHLENSIVVGISDHTAVSRWIVHLNSNRQLLQNLNENAKKTAYKWQKNEDSSKDFLRALQKLYTPDALPISFQEFSLKKPPYWRTQNIERHYVNRQFLREQKYLAYGIRLIKNGEFELLFRHISKLLMRRMRNFK